MLPDAVVAKLLGTTKATIESVRSRQHWNTANIKPVDPVTLGLVGQIELDEVVRKAAEKKAREDARKGGGATLKGPGEGDAEPPEAAEADEESHGYKAEPTADSVFGSRED